ncbi:hypothetical protein [Iningainema tapete]|uniref:Uncharacterized protein n=1 Tax=Iningainema tapete BLCC-T55 TaxID=2748662 RepID=A0A8J7BXA4_9CYAN|nr:hypothetical protein [Iningainema tapete]MBD2773432.1 hypothetical protein [Iningainema tapete BLCC-T55]
MKDNISLVAAAAGGFMLSVALSGILHGTPVVSWHPQKVSSTQLAIEFAFVSNERSNTQEKQQ